MVRHLTLRSAGRTAFSTHGDIYIGGGGVIPDVLMQRRRNLKLQGVTRHGAHATRHAALATSVLLFLLLTSAAALAAAPAWVTSSGNVAFTTVTLE